MTEQERKQLDELHSFFMKPDLPNAPSRAQRIDELLNAAKTTRLGVRAFLWLCGVIVVLSAAVNVIKGGELFK